METKRAIEKYTKYKEHNINVKDLINETRRIVKEAI